MKLEKLKKQEVNFITKDGQRQRITFQQLWLEAHKNSKSKLTPEKFLLVNKNLLEGEWVKILYVLDKSVTINNMPFYKRWVVKAKEAVVKFYVEKIRVLFTKKVG